MISRLQGIFWNSKIDFVSHPYCMYTLFVDSLNIYIYLYIIYIYTSNLSEGLAIWSFQRNIRPTSRFRFTQVEAGFELPRKAAVMVVDVGLAQKQKDYG